MKRIILAAALVAFATCGQTAGTTAIGIVSRSTPIEAGSVCAHGGTSVEVGVDDNKDGALSDDEVDSKAAVCQPAMPAPAPVLSRTTVLAASSTDCLGVGGVKVEVGLDNGDGGGTAADGTLQDGEVDSSKPVCAGAPAVPESLEAPAGAAGTAVIDTSGGSTDAGQGGQAGQIRLSHYGSGGGALRVFATGSVDAGYTAPAATPTAGAKPLAITAATTIKTTTSATDVSQLSNNDLVTIGETGYVYRFTGGNSVDTSAPFTSLSVSAGTVLSIDGSTLRFDGDIVNDGTITSSFDTNGRAHSITIYALRYQGNANAVLSTSGTDGGTGGSLNVLTLRDITNAGTIRSSGSEGDTGAAATQLYMQSARIDNRGTIEAVGGRGRTGAGGVGGTISLTADNMFANAGTIRTNGGDGITLGGSAQPIYIWVPYGIVYHSGRFEARGGGQMNSCASSCPNGGQVNLSSSVGQIIASGTFDTSGGPGGDGGQINIGAYTYGGAHALDGSVWLSGSIVTRGGSSTRAGTGGSVYISAQSSQVTRATLTLMGFAELKASGGSGQIGGNGAYIGLRSSADQDVGLLAFAGSIVNAATLTSRGGDGSAGNGGYGNSIDLYISNSHYGKSGLERVVNLGAINARGGNGTSESAPNNAFGGSVGTLYLYGPDGVDNRGAIDARGGTGSGRGGEGGSVYLTSETGLSVTTGTIDVSGGTTTGTAGKGGGAGTAVVEGNTAHAGANISAAGANGGASGEGGSGGLIVVRSLSGAPMITGTMNVAGGTGTPAGQPGAVSTDGYGPSYLNGYD